MDKIEIMKCLNCGYEFELDYTKIFVDDLGTGVKCPECNSTLDIL